MKMLGRSYVWWAGIDKDIENFTKKIHICQKTQNVPKGVVTTSWNKTTAFPFERVHIDFFTFRLK